MTEMTTCTSWATVILLWPEAEVLSNVYGRTLPEHILKPLSGCEGGFSRLNVQYHRQSPTLLARVRRLDTDCSTPSPQLAAGLSAGDIYRDRAVLSRRDKHMHRVSRGPIACTLRTHQADRTGVKKPFLPKSGLSRKSPACESKKSPACDPT